MWQRLARDLGQGAREGLGASLWSPGHQPAADNPAVAVSALPRRSGNPHNTGPHLGTHVPLVGSLRATLWSPPLKPTSFVFSDRPLSIFF